VAQSARRFFPMRARGAVLTVVCTGVALAGVHPTQAQEAASANLPDQFQTGEMIQIQKPKKKKAESRSQTLATAAKQNPAPVPEQTRAAKEVATQMAMPEERKAEPPQGNASTPPSEKVAPVTEHAPPAEESAVAAEPEEKKPRAKRRSRHTLQPEAASISAPVP